MGWHQSKRVYTLLYCVRFWYAHQEKKCIQGLNSPYIFFKDLETGRPKALFLVQERDKVWEGVRWSERLQIKMESSDTGNGRLREILHCKWRLARQINPYWKGFIRISGLWVTGGGLESFYEVYRWRTVLLERLARLFLGYHPGNMLTVPMERDDSGITMDSLLFG